jgi:hydroxymethylpyrimidine/phosphomethylpyrimidine kinase
MHSIKTNIIAAVQLIEACQECVHILPQVGTNIAMALPNATDLKDIAGLTGRIIRVEDQAVGVGTPKFGATRYLGTVLLAAISLNPHFQAVINIRHSSKIIATCEKLGMKAITYVWDIKPKEVIEFGCAIPSIIHHLGSVPEVIYDHGDIGIEASVTIFGSDALNVAYKAIRIAQQLSRQ